jgi:oligosaccharide 4-alpha-D-glucosyltransferase
LQLTLTYLKQAYLVIGLFFICQSFAYAKTSHHYISHAVEDNSLLIQTSLGQVQLNAYGDGVIEAHYLLNQRLANKNLANGSPQKNNNTKKAIAQQLPSFAIKEQAIKQNFQLAEDNKKLTITLNKLSAVITKSPFNISYYQAGNLLIAEEAGVFLGTAHGTNDSDNANSTDTIDTNVQGFRFKLTNEEKLLGGGERVLGMDRRGHRLPLYNRAHYGYETQSAQMNFSLPAVMSSNKYIVLFDNSAKGWMDIAKSEKNILQFEAVSGRLAYIVFSGDTYPELINNYVAVTGKQPLPPRWALGNYASRFGYRSEVEVRSTVNKFIELDFPLDALILDLYWFGKEIKGHMGNLAWDKAVFPSPTKMMADIKAQGVNTVLITEPFILTSSKRWSDAVEHNALAKSADGSAKRFDFYFGNTGLVDVFNSQGQDWFNAIYKNLYHQGVSGWWGDLGEPEVHPSDTLHTFDDGMVVNADAIHNVYGHQWAKMVFDNQLALDKTKRPFILMRSGFAGSQRYGMIPWTGDVSRSWGGLKPQVELNLQMGILGMAYTHSDLGGFAGGETFNKELYIRWLQYGIFQPIYRPHGQDNIAPEVVFHDTETQSILRKFIKLRYQLLPYNYSLAYENSTTGMPLMRPLFFDNERLGQESEKKQSLSLMDNAASYLWGDAFLVTPVVDAGIKAVSIPLPNGVWFNYFTDEYEPQKKYQGGQTVSVPTDLTTLPVLVRAGSFIPMIEATQSTRDYDNSKLTLHYYADSSVTSAEYEMYEDDGETHQAIKQGLYELLHFSASQKDNSLKINFARDIAHQSKAKQQAHKQGYAGMPTQREMSVVIHNWATKPNSIKIDQMAIDTAIWNKEQNTLSIHFIWQHQPLSLSVN